MQQMQIALFLKLFLSIFRWSSVRTAIAYIWLAKMWDTARTAWVQMMANASANSKHRTRATRRPSEQLCQQNKCKKTKLNI